MIDPSKAKRINDSCTEAAQGYCIATGATFAALSAAWFQSVIETLESVRPDRSEDEPPKSWYRHPDRIDLLPRRDMTTSWPQAAFKSFETSARQRATEDSPWETFASLARLNPFVAMFIPASTNAGGPAHRSHRSAAAPADIPLWPILAPLPGWWTCRATRHPTVTWPMAYSLTLAGVPNAIAWPFAEANAAALDAAQTTVQAIGDVLERSSSDRAGHDHTHRCPTCDRPHATAGSYTPKRETAEAPQASQDAASPLGLAVSMQTAGFDAWCAWLDGFSATLNPDVTPARTTRH